MTIEQIVCVSLGSIFQVTVFVLGVFVGIGIAKQKGVKSDDGYSYYNTEEEQGRSDSGTGVIRGGVRGGIVRGAIENAKPNSEKRPAVRRKNHRNGHGRQSLDGDRLE